VRLLFINLNQSPAYGGIERWMLDTAQGLGARGHQSVLLGRPQAPWMDVATRMGLRVRDDHHGTWAARALRVRAAMREERPDVVIAKAKKAARMAAWGRALGGGGRVALIFGLTHELRPNRWIDRYTWRRVDAGIVLAHGAARWYAEHGFGPLSKLPVLWKGVDVARFDEAHARRDAVRAELGLRPDELAIGTVGRLAWQKGLDDLMGALAIARDRLPPSRVFIAGGGRDAPIVEAAAAELGGLVTLLGQRDDVPALLAALDVVVLPSRREVMSQATLESMAAGRAVLSTSTVGADEAIEDGTSGVLVPVGDRTAIADGLVSLARDPARRAALGAAARRRIGEHFTVEHTLDRCERIFRSIARGEPGDQPLVERPT
jgi:glycosyltransferase involved in cell wall biosynthesis